MPRQDKVSGFEQMSLAACAAPIQESVLPKLKAGQLALLRETLLRETLLRETLLREIKILILLKKSCDLPLLRSPDNEFGSRAAICGDFMGPTGLSHCQNLMSSIFLAA